MDTEAIEIRLLVESLRLKYGYDFRGYSEASLARRIDSLREKLECRTVSQLQDRILHDESLLEAVLSTLTVPTSEMFRDPRFFKALREKVFPLLATFPSINIWDAGCSTGEELYSLLILLREHGLWEKTRVYATDLNPAALEAARKGIYPAERMAKFTWNYNQAGGTEGLSHYYSSLYGSVRMDPDLIRNVIFPQHNLVTDGPFIEAHLILCRNVFIYFRRALQERALKLFTRSLRHGGFLGVGRQETIRFLKSAHHYEDWDSEGKLYRKKTGAAALPEPA